MKLSKTGKLYVRPVLLGMAIFAIVLSHFAVSQFISFQTEKNSIVTEAINKQPVEAKTEFRVPEPDIVVTPKKDASVFTLSKPETDRIVTKKAEIKQTVIKKKEILQESKQESKHEPRQESKSDRLRRAERLLTGV